MSSLKTMKIGGIKLLLSLMMVAGISQSLQAAVTGTFSIPGGLISPYSTWIRINKNTTEPTITCTVITEEGTTTVTPHFSFEKDKGQTVSLLFGPIYAGIDPGRGPEDFFKTWFVGLAKLSDGTIRPYVAECALLDGELTETEMIINVYIHNVNAGFYNPSTRIQILGAAVIKSGKIKIAVSNLATDKVNEIEFRLPDDIHPYEVPLVGDYFYIDNTTIYFKIGSGGNARSMWSDNILGWLITDGLFK